MSSHVLTSNASSDGWCTSNATFLKASGFILVSLSLGALVAGIALPDYHNLDPRYVTDTDVHAWAFREGIRSLIITISSIFLAVGVITSASGFYSSKKKTTTDSETFEAKNKKWRNTALLIGLGICLFAVSLMTISALYHYHVVWRTEVDLGWFLDHAVPGTDTWKFWWGVKTDWLDPMQSTTSLEMVGGAAALTAAIALMLSGGGGYAYLKKKWAIYFPEDNSTDKDL